MNQHPLFRGCEKIVKQLKLNPLFLGHEDTKPRRCTKFSELMLFYFVHLRGFVSSSLRGNNYSCNDFDNNILIASLGGSNCTSLFYIHTIQHRVSFLKTCYKYFIRFHHSLFL